MHDGEMIIRSESLDQSKASTFGDWVSEKGFIRI